MISQTLQAKRIKERRLELNLPVYDGGLGENPLPPPKMLYESLSRHAHRNEYTDCRGIPQLKCLGTHLLVGNGLKPLILTLQIAFQKVYPNGQLVFIAPAWVSYVEQAKLVSANYTIVEPRKWLGRITPEELDEALSHVRRPHVVFFNNPNNPSGYVYTVHEVERFAKIFLKHNSIVFADEIYKDLIHPQHAFNFAPLKNFYHLTITGSSLSKSFACGGYRLGWMSFHPQLSTLYETCQAVASSTYSCPTTCLQYVAADLLRADMSEYLKSAARHFENVKFYCVQALRTMHIHTNGMAAWYLLLDFEYYKDALPVRTSDELRDMLLREGVIMVSGTAFGIRKPLVLRYAYVDKAPQCMAKLKDILKKYKTI